MMRVVSLIIFSFISLSSFAQQAIYSRDRSLLIPTKSKKTDKQDISFGALLNTDLNDFPYWRESIRGVQKKALRLDSKVVSMKCSECIESYAGMFQFKMTTQSGKTLRGTLHHEMEANLFRFQMMHELGYILPEQSYQPLLKVEFSNRGEKDNFIFSIKSHMGLASNAGWRQFIEEEGEDWVLLKSVLVENDWKNKLKGYHWLNLYDGQVAEHKAIRRLFPLFILSDWGDQLNIDAKQFIRRKQGAILIKHPLNDFFKKTNLQELQWMVGRILKLDNPAIARSIDAMGVRRDQRSVLTAKIYALLNHFQEVFFSRSEIENLNLAERRTNFIVDESIKPSIVTRNWRYYVMLGVDRLAQTALKEASKQLQLNWSKELATIGNVTKDELSNFFDKDSQKIVLPLRISSYANIGLKARFSRDLVRGQYYGNSHLANMADTLRYGANASLGLHFDIFGNLPLSIFQGAEIEFQEIHLRPVSSQEQAYEKFFNEWPSPIKLLKWKKSFKKHKCILDEDKENNCNDIVNFLDQFQDEFKLDETLILSKNYSFPNGASVGFPNVDVLYNLNPFSGSRLSWTKGKVDLDRISVIRTESGVRIIKTESESKFREWIAQINFFLPFLSWSNRETQEKPTTKVFDIDFAFFDEQRKIDTFLALKELFIHRSTHYLEKNFSYEKLDSNLFIFRSQHPVYGTDLIARKKDQADLKNELIVHNYKYDVELQTHLKSHPRHLVLFKSVTRKYWDWLGALEDVVNFFLPFKLKIRLRSVREGEFAGDLRRSAKIKILTTEADLTDRARGLFEPIVVIKEKRLKFKANRKRVIKVIRELRQEYKDHFEKISFPSLKMSLEKIKEFELAKVLVLKSRLVKRLINDLILHGKTNLLPESSKLTRKLEAFFRKNKKSELDISQKISLVHFALAILSKKKSLAQIISHLKSQGQGDDIVYDLQLKGWMYYKGEKEPQFLPYNLNPDIFRHESIFRRLVKELGLPNYEVHGSLLVPEF